MTESYSLCMTGPDRLSANAPGLGPWVHGGEAGRAPDGWTVDGERALKTPAGVKG